MVASGNEEVALPVRLTTPKVIVSAEAMAWSIVNPPRNEPTIPMIRDGALAAKDHHCVIGFGGGSAIDAAKDERCRERLYDQGT